ncbi:hypothetical protein PSN01_04730 [Micromonospora saelicesensis]|nr:hypothetical protein PSN01_04730 [Micromonospora saelicesensis]
MTALQQEPDRHDQGRHVAVDGDQLADRDVTGHRHPGRQPHHRRQEQPGDGDSRRVDPAVDRADPVALGAQLLGPGRVPPGEQVPAAHPGEHPQPGHDVTGSGGERALLLAIDRFDLLQAAQQRPHDQTDDRHPHQHAEREHRGDRPEHHGDHPVRDDRADARPGQRQHLRCPVDVGTADGGHLARPDPAGQHRADAGQVAQQNLRRAGLGVLPDEGHRAVPHDAQVGQGHARDDDRRDPERQGLGVAFAQPVVDGAGDQVGPGREPDHPGRADQAAAQHPPGLAADQPPEVAHRAAGVGGARIGMRDLGRHPITLPSGPDTPPTRSW